MGSHMREQRGVRHSTRCWPWRLGVVSWVALGLAACGPGEPLAGEETGTLASAITQAECSSLVPSTSAAANRANIQACLDTWNFAWLQAGQIYNIDGSLNLGPGDVLKGLDANNYSVIQPHLASASYTLTANALINLASTTGATTGARLQYVKLNLRDARPSTGTQKRTRPAIPSTNPAMPTPSMGGAAGGTAG